MLRPMILFATYFPVVVELKILQKAFRRNDRAEGVALQTKIKREWNEIGEKYSRNTGFRRANGVACV